MKLKDPTPEILTKVDEIVKNELGLDKCPDLDLKEGYYMESFRDSLFSEAGKKEIIIIALGTRKNVDDDIKAFVDDGNLSEYTLRKFRKNENTKRHRFYDLGNDIFMWAEIIFSKSN